VLPIEECYIPEYYVGVNVEFLGLLWKNQGLGLAISARTCIQNVISKFDNNLSKSNGPKVRMTVYVDTHHAYDLVSRESITDILLMLNNTSIIRVSKRQKTVETSTYGSELVSSSIDTELILEVRFIRK
jgi:hypothetical protein